jgi:hypothetical protein
LLVFGYQSEDAVTMRLLRWKDRFRTGDVAADRRNRAFVDCLNKLINASSQRERCREVEELIEQFRFEAEQTLRERPANRDLKHEFGSRLLSSLPLSPFGGPACRECGLCNLELKQVTEQLEAPGRCLFEKRNP